MRCGRRSSMSCRPSGRIPRAAGPGSRTGRCSAESSSAAGRGALAAAPSQGAGLWQRGDLLAAAAGLASRWGVGAVASSAAGLAGRRRPDRLVTSGHRQRQCAGPAWGELTGANPVDRGKGWLQVPPADRRRRDPVGGGAIGRQQPRLPAVRTAGGRGASNHRATGPTRSAAQAPGQALWRQGLRRSGLPAGAAPPRHHPTGRPPWGGVPAPGWADSVGRSSGPWPGCWPIGVSRSAMSAALTC